MTQRQTIGRVAQLGIALFVTTAPAVRSQTPPSAESASLPTPAQERYLNGLRTTGRGVAQLKSGVDRVMRSRSDAAELRTAGQRLGGLCGSAASFMRQGRARMAHIAFTDSVRVIARRLNTQIDSVIAFLPTCQRRGGQAPEQTAATIVTRLRSYEAALQRFREAVILPAAAQADSGSSQ